MKLFLILILVMSLLLVGCGKEKIDLNEGYEKCTAVCAAVVADDLEVQWLCYEQCKKEFLINQT